MCFRLRAALADDGADAVSGNVNYNREVVNQQLAERYIVPLLRHPVTSYAS